MIPNDHSSTDTLSTTGSFASVPCPACEGTLARRAHRDGLAEKMFSLLYVYPFRCQLCGHRFLTLQWGIRYHRIAQDSGDHRLVGTPVRANPSCSLR
jgi:hypothetical protein